MTTSIALLIIVGLIAIGIKLYTSRNSTKQDLETAQDRYENAKYNFYQTQQALLPLLIENGKMKLEIWREFQRAADALETVEYLPHQIKYQNFELFRVGKPELEVLRETAKTVVQLEGNGIAEIGSGIFTGLALYGGAISQKANSFELANFPNFPQYEEGYSILETLSTRKIIIPADSIVAESAILNSILETPTVLQDSNNDNLSLKDKDETKKTIAAVNKQATELIEAADVIQRVQQALSNITEPMQSLYDKYEVNIEKLERLVTAKKDFDSYTPEEQNILIYTAYLVRVLKGLTRTNLLLKRGNLYIFNTAEIKEYTDITRKLFVRDSIK